MDHSIALSGLGFALEPASVDHAEFIVSLRNSNIDSGYIHADRSLSVKDQLDWFEDYKSREEDWYFVIRNLVSGELEGTIGIYNLEQSKDALEWGRWILRTGSLAAIESTLLIYRVGFNYLSAREMYCRTVSKNKAVVSFHTSCGLRVDSVIENCFKINDRWVQATKHALPSEEWPRVEETLDKMSRRIVSTIQNEY